MTVLVALANEDSFSEIHWELVIAIRRGFSMSLREISPNYAKGKKEAQVVVMNMV